MRRSVLWSGLLCSVAAMLLAVPAAASPAPSGSLLFRCGPNICRVAPDGSGRQQLTRDGKPGGPAYSWISASRDGSRLGVIRASYAFVLDGAGRKVSGPLPRGGLALVAEISPDGKRVATLEAVGETRPPPVSSPAGSPSLFSFQPYLFTVGADGRGRAVVARAVVSTAWLGSRLLRSDTSREEPFTEGICLLATNTDFRCGQDVARDPHHHLFDPAPSPNSLTLAVTQAGADRQRTWGAIVLYDVASGRKLRALTSGTTDSSPTWSPDGRQVAFNRGRDVYVIAVDGKPGSERRVVRGGTQPVWVSGSR